MHFRAYFLPHVKAALRQPHLMSGRDRNSTIWANMEDNVKRQRREVLGTLTAAVGSALLPGSFAAAEQDPAASPSVKEPVTGIGGFFFRAHDP